MDKAIRAPGSGSCLLSGKNANSANAAMATMGRKIQRLAEASYIGG